MKYSEIPSESVIVSTIENLSKNGIDASVVENSTSALEKVLTLIPKGAEVMTMTSVTLSETGIEEKLNRTGEYASVKKRLSEMGDEDARKKRQLGAAPDFAVGSVHAVTMDGEVLIASNTGSQLPAYVYGAGKVIWVVGAQKIVRDKELGMNRINEYVLPLETVRARSAYNLPDTYNSNVSKLLFVNREVEKGRIHLIFVKEKLGF